MTRLVGVDLGLKVSAVAWRNELGRVCTTNIVPPGQPPKKVTTEVSIRRLVAVADRVIGAVRMTGATAVAIEGYAYGQAHRGLVFTIAELGGVVRYLLLRELGLVPVIIPPTSARLLALGHGGLSKAEAAARVRRALKGQLAAREGQLSDDECDAYVVLRALEIMARPAEVLEAKQAAVAKRLLAQSGVVAA